MTTPLRPAHLLAAAALLALALAGCDRNQPGTALAPTGIRPAPARWPGGVTGVVHFDPLNTPDLASPPFPPTRIELWRDTLRIAVDSIGGATNTFKFTNVVNGVYSVVVRSSAFYANSIGGVQVLNQPRDAGDVTLTINYAAFANGMELLGTIPGFRETDQSEYLFGLDVGELSTSALGLWTYPSADYPDGQAIPAGTYRFKFATEWPLTSGVWTGWGNALGDTITVPATNHPSLLASGAANDIVMKFPQTGVYGFTVDERRQTFSVRFLHAAPARPARAARR